MVSLAYKLFSGQGVQEGKVFLCLLQTHCPGNIPGNDHRILGADEPSPIFFQPLHIIVPALEDIHGLISSEGQVQIGNRKQ